MQHVHTVVLTVPALPKIFFGLSMKYFLCLCFVCLCFLKKNKTIFTEQSNLCWCSTNHWKITGSGMCPRTYIVTLAYIACMLILLQKGVCPTSPMLCNIQLYSVFFLTIVSSTCFHSAVLIPGLVTLDHSQLLASPTHTRVGPLLNAPPPKKSIAFNISKRANVQLSGELTRVGVIKD